MAFLYYVTPISTPHKQVIRHLWLPISSICLGMFAFNTLNPYVTLKIYFWNTIQTHNTVCYLGCLKGINSFSILSKIQWFCCIFFLGFCTFWEKTLGLSWTNMKIILPANLWEKTFTYGLSWTHMKMILSTYLSKLLYWWVMKIAFSFIWQLRIKVTFNALIALN